jgi:hypothetical protein
MLATPLRGFMVLERGEFYLLNCLSILCMRTVDADVHIYVNKNRSELDRKVKRADCRYARLRMNLEVSGQLHAPAALPPGKSNRIPIPGSSIPYITVATL